MQGQTPSLFVGTQAFEIIVKQQIKRLEEPGVKCCQLVYDELIRILGQLLQKIVRIQTTNDRRNVLTAQSSKRLDDSLHYGSGSTLLLSISSRLR
jgi:hypothetical protein